MNSMETNRQQLPQILAHLKEREARNQDNSPMSDKDKHQAALEKARQYQAQKKKNKNANEWSSIQLLADYLLCLHINILHIDVTRKLLHVGNKFVYHVILSL